MDSIARHRSVNIELVSDRPENNWNELAPQRLRLLLHVNPTSITLAVVMQPSFLFWFFFLRQTPDADVFNGYESRSPISSKWTCARISHLPAWVGTVLAKILAHKLFALQVLVTVGIVPPIIPAFTGWLGGKSVRKLCCRERRDSI